MKRVQQYQADNGQPQPALALWPCPCDCQTELAHERERLQPLSEKALACVMPRVGS